MRMWPSINFPVLLFYTHDCGFSIILPGTLLDNCLITPQWKDSQISCILPEGITEPSAYLSKETIVFFNQLVFKWAYKAAGFLMKFSYITLNGCSFPTLTPPCFPPSIPCCSLAVPLLPILLEYLIVFHFPSHSPPLKSLSHCIMELLSVSWTLFIVTQNKSKHKN